MRYSISFLLLYRQPRHAQPHRVVVPPVRMGSGQNAKQPQPSSRFNIAQCLHYLQVSTQDKLVASELAKTRCSNQLPAITRPADITLHFDQSKLIAERG